MESFLNKPNFTDSNILKLTNTIYWVTLVKSKITRREIILKESKIVICLNLENFGQMGASFEILFRDRWDNLIGSFIYSIYKNPINTEADLFLNDVLFLSNFASNRSYLTKSQAIEKLMEYPDIKEWLLWNQP